MNKSILWQHRLETISAAGVLLWGASLLNPFVNSFEVQRSYAVMAQYANENLWGGAAVVIGLLGLVGMMLGNKPMRYIGTLGAMFYRTFTLVFIGLQNNFTNSGTGDFLLWAIMALLAYNHINDDR